MARIKGKELRFSKTFWVAVLQSIAGLIAIFAIDNPTLDAVGIALQVKSVIDVVLRVITTDPIESL